jgi:hypothetical protein
MVVKEVLVVMVVHSVEITKKGSLLGEKGGLLNGKIFQLRHSRQLSSSIVISYPVQLSCSSSAHCLVKKCLKFDNLTPLGKLIHLCRKAPRGDAFIFPGLGVSNLYLLVRVASGSL